LTKHKIDSIIGKIVKLPGKNPGSFNPYEKKLEAL